MNLKIKVDRKKQNHPNCLHCIWAYRWTTCESKFKGHDERESKTVIRGERGERELLTINGSCRETFHVK